MGSRRSGKPRYTAEIHASICKYLRVGAFFRHAAEASGVSADAAKEWVAKGLAGDKRYQSFALDVRKAQSDYAVRMQSIVTRAAARGDGRMACWSLERHFPKEYGQAAVQSAASVTLRGSDAATSDDNANVTTVQFWLPSNGRRPDEPDDEE